MFIGIARAWKKVKFKKLNIKEEREWLFMNLVASEEVAETEKRLREAQELVIKGWAMALEYNIHSA